MAPRALAAVQSAAPKLSAHRRASGLPTMRWTKGDSPRMRFRAPWPPVTITPPVLTRLCYAPSSMWYMLGIACYHQPSDGTCTLPRGSAFLPISSYHYCDTDDILCSCYTRASMRYLCTVECAHIRRWIMRYLHVFHEGH